MTSVLLLAGDFAKPLWPISNNDFIIAVDGGIRHALTLNIIPDLWIGDFDSSSSELQAKYANVPQLCFPQDKDATDYELALNYLMENNRHHKLSIIGSHGNEADHNYCNIHLLAAYPFKGVLWQENTVIAFGPALKIQANVTLGDKVSIFALKTIKNIVYSGLKWPVMNGELSPFSSLASRNIAIDNSITIDWDEGFALVYLNHPAAITFR